MRLITIPLSHYCERARWALDRSGTPYVEDQHLQMFHIRQVRRAGGRHTVPLLVTPEGPLTDSAEIVAYADRRSPPERRLYPDDAAARQQVEDLERQHASEFGVATRRWAYHRLLPHRRLLGKYNGGGAPLHERVALRIAFPFAKREVSRYLKIDDETAAKGREVALQVFDSVAERLADGRPYLTGDAFTAADLTFAALAAPMLFPPEYAARQRRIALPAIDELPAALAEEVAELRAHPAAAFVLRVYERERAVGLA
jgi:glutathione S-transferase